jgi:hypothetical protein
MFKAASMSTQNGLEDSFIAELLIAKAERQLQEAIDDFGWAFVSVDRPKITALIQDLQQAIGTPEAATIALIQFELNAALGHFSERVAQRHQEEEAYWAETYWEGPV